jgi:dihydrofolate reductase
MGRVVLDISMSLDGYIAGRDDGPDQALGKDGERLHDWIFETGIFKKSDIQNKLFETTGAIVAGRRVYEPTSGWGGNHPIRGVPVYVLSHDIPENVPLGGTVFNFVTEGVDVAIREAKEAAGDKDVYVMGGASVAQQCLRASLLDEIQVHIAPVLLTEGIRLFEHIGSDTIRLETIRILESHGTTHLRYRILK